MTDLDCCPEVECSVDLRREELWRFHVSEAKIQTSQNIIFAVVCGSEEAVLHIQTLL